MILSKETFQLLLELGAPPEKVAAFLHSLDCDMAAFSTPPPPSAGAARQRRYRERHQTSQSVTDRNECNGGDERVSPKEIPPTPPKEITPSQTVTTEARAGDWRTMLAEAKEAAGETADLTIPTMQSARDLRPFLEPTVGEPCTWDEVLEAIRITGARQAKKGKRIRSWSWIADDAWALRDRRLSSAAPDVSTVVQLRGHGPPGLVAEIAAEKAEARRRTLEMMSPKNG